MAVQLQIDDGNPWYLSPDIWAVPGADPSGPPGVPIAGEPTYVWARVHNLGTDPVSNAAVNYYWANPSTVITQNTATLIGTSYVDLGGGQSAEVLCLTPWVPSWVNSGHECLVVEVVSAQDPPPPRGPDDPFDPAGERQMAQRNLNLIEGAQQLVVFPFLAGNARRLRDREITIRVERAPVDRLGKLVESLGLDHIPREAAASEEFGIQPYRCGDQLHEVGRRSLTLALDPGAQHGFALAVHLSRHDTGHGALYLIEQVAGQRVIGGIGVLVLAPTAKG